MQAKKDGIEINEQVEVCEIAFTGDTTIFPLLENPVVMNARILIMECSEIDRDGPIEPFVKFGHIHIKQIEENQDKFKNDIIVLHHFASKQTKNEIIENFNKSQLSDEFKSKCRLFLEGFE